LSGVHHRLNEFIRIERGSGGCSLHGGKDSGEDGHETKHVLEGGGSDCEQALTRSLRDKN
jgi:hypothetical protein